MGALPRPGQARLGWVGPGRAGRALHRAPESRGMPRTGAALTRRHLWTEGRAMAAEAPGEVGAHSRPFKRTRCAEGDRAVESPRLAALLTACQRRSPHGSRAGASATQAHPDRLRTANVIGKRQHPVKGLGYTPPSPPPLPGKRQQSGAPAAPPGAGARGTGLFPPLGGGTAGVRGRQRPARRRPEQRAPPAGTAAAGKGSHRRGRARLSSPEAEISQPARTRR